MLDLETFGTRHDALIVQIGACYFDRETGAIGETFEATIEYKEDIDKFSVDYSTLKWWLEQTRHAQDSVVGRSVTSCNLPTALVQLNRFLERGPVMVWSHATFDMPILMNAYATLAYTFSVPYRNMRDLRTLMELYGEKAQIEREGVHHHALDDAKYQARYASIAMQKLNGRS